MRGYRAGQTNGSAHTTALLGFVVSFIFAILCLRPYSVRDPSSVFFNPQRAFDPIYSTVRQKQADAFITDVQRTLPARRQRHAPQMFVGLVTVQRYTHQYFTTALGSLLEGLSDRERSEIDLTVFIANTDPSVHDAYHQPWLHGLVDSVLTYENATAQELAQLRYLETSDVKHLNKPLRDYRGLLEHGYASGAPWVVLLEDDVLAMDGWYHRTKAALAQLRSQGEESNSIYVRLFYNERLHGWNSEEWSRYLFWSVVITMAIAMILHQLRRHHAPSARFLTPVTTFVILLVCTPMCISLYFAAGRLTVAPLAPGLRRMEKYGCCSQAFAFPREQVPDLVQFYQQEGEGYADVLTEEYAESRGLHRWALVPSVFQHVGASSSKGDKSNEFTRWNRTGAQNIWNFSFELLEADSLRKEHMYYKQDAR